MPSTHTFPFDQRLSRCVAEDVLSSMRPHEVKRVRAEQLEATENEKLMTPAERRKRRKAKQRHAQLKIIAGSAAGVTRVAVDCRCPCSWLRVHVQHVRVARLAGLKEAQTQLVGPVCAVLASSAVVAEQLAFLFSPWMGRYPSAAGAAAWRALSSTSVCRQAPLLSGRGASTANDGEGQGGSLFHVAHWHRW